MLRRWLAWPVITLLIIILVVYRRWTLANLIKWCEHFISLFIGIYCRIEANDANVEPEVETAFLEPEPVADETKVEAGEAETMVEIQTEELKNEVWFKW